MQHRRLLLVPLLATLPGVTVPAPSRAQVFDPVDVYRAPAPIYALATADLVPAHPGPEVALLTVSGEVIVVTPGPGLWTGETAVAPGDTTWGMSDRPTVAAGDLDPQSPGAEIAALSHQRLNVATRDGNGAWSVVTIFDSEGLVGDAWGARVGDYRPSRPGDEILMIYEGVMDVGNGVLYELDGNEWQDTAVYAGEVGMDSAAGEFDAAHAGAEFVITTEMGPTYEILEPAGSPGGTWPRQTLWNDFDNAGWVCRIGDVDETHPGNEIVYGTRYRNAILVSTPAAGGGHDLTVAFVGASSWPNPNMYDVAVGDLDPASATVEIVGVDAGGNLYLVGRREGTWQGSTLWHDPRGALNAVVAGDFLPDFPGDELVVAGDAGFLTLLRRHAATGVPDDPPWLATLRRSLACRPNPGNPAATIHFSLARELTLRVTIHALDGRLVARLAAGPFAAGSHDLVWHGTDLAGRPVPSGVYCYRVEAGGRVLTGSLTVAR